MCRRGDNVNKIKSFDFFLNFTPSLLEKKPGEKKKLKNFAAGEK